MRIKERKKDIVITCPHCGREYLPAEIYVPDAFFGKPSDIEKNTSGKIEAYDGTAMDLKEEYFCDNCGTLFTVEASIRFKTTEKEDKPFNEIYISPLYAEKISLKED